MRTEYDPQTLAGPLPRQRECRTYYGSPGAHHGTVRDRLQTIELTFPLRLSWDLATTTRKMTVHRLCAPHLKRAMEQVYFEYGSERFVSLGLDIYAGGYNPRKMRGKPGQWSMHAYGCAIDLHPEGNELDTPADRALFGQPVYERFLDIMESNGWLPAIRLWGADAMHFQMARTG